MMINERSNRHSIHDTIPRAEVLTTYSIQKYSNNFSKNQVRGCKQAVDRLVRKARLAISRISFVDHVSFFRKAVR